MKFIKFFFILIDYFLYIYKLILNNKRKKKIFLSKLKNIIS